MRTRNRPFMQPFIELVIIFGIVAIVVAIGLLKQCCG